MPRSCSSAASSPTRTRTGEARGSSTQACLRFRPCSAPLSNSALPLGRSIREVLGIQTPFQPGEIEAAIAQNRWTFKVDTPPAQAN